MKKEKENPHGSYTFTPFVKHSSFIMNNILLFEHNLERKERYVVYIILIDVKSDYHFIQHSGQLG